jgi:hypothetical protein
MDDITPEHAKWLDDAPKRINERVRTTLADIATGNAKLLDYLADDIIPDHHLFVSQALLAVATYDDEQLGHGIRAVIMEAIKADAEKAEAKAVYDPVFDSPPWEE